MDTVLSSHSQIHARLYAQIRTQTHYLTCTPPPSSFPQDARDRLEPLPDLRRTFGDLLSKANRSPPNPFHIASDFVLIRDLLAAGGGEQGELDKVLTDPVRRRQLQVRGATCVQHVWRCLQS